jgi:hypothetical protein
VVSGSNEDVDQPGAESRREFQVSSQDEVARHFIERDPTGQLFATMHYMSSVEDWVFDRLGDNDKEKDEQVRVRLQRLDSVIIQFRDQIPPDNSSFLQILSWLSMAQSMYTVEYLQLCQPAFFRQLVEHCRSLLREDMTARIAYDRIMTLLRVRLLDRILGRDNTDFVTRIIVEAA